MKLLIDGNEPSQSVETITEQVGQDKKYYIEGIFAQAEKKNRKAGMVAAWRNHAQRLARSGHC